ncbi:MAG TPA: hypothetical protein ENN61_03425, partial [Bacteroidaceae bacterium]|nr:hypothetical protein [Bacteroidaceae bacterium]
MMRIYNVFILLSALCLCNLSELNCQNAGLESITIPELEAHTSFLASDELMGRKTGDQGLMVAARYLATQARLIGLIPLDDEKDYFQYFTILEKNYDPDRTQVVITDQDHHTSCLKDEFFVIPRGDEAESVIEGEVVFAGYGINA